MAINVNKTTGRFPSAANDLASSSGTTVFDWVALGGDSFLVILSKSGTINLTVASVVDKIGRKGDLVDSIASGVIKMFGPFPSEGWADASGNINMTSDSTEWQISGLTVQ